MLGRKNPPPCCVEMNIIKFDTYVLPAKFGASGTGNPAAHERIKDNPARFRHGQNKLGKDAKRLLIRVCQFFALQPLASQD